MVRLNLKIFVKGSIIEPVVAIVIMVMVFGFAMVFLSKYSTIYDLKAINVANEMIDQELYNVVVLLDLNTDDVVNGALVLKKNIEVNKMENILFINFVVNDRENKIISKRQIILPMGYITF
ncbi:MAG: hypothetical protein JXA77_00440 [Bacteroidales bacterium]|nr:hypothetical protein [Bacteroidales bacterium]MBN2817641.1 hypothetical protein [Bacteroidales bacterium]